jgi:hypothetical protein
MCKYQYLPQFKKKEADIYRRNEGSNLAEVSSNNIRVPVLEIIENIINVEDQHSENLSPRSITGENSCFRLQYLSNMKILISWMASHGDPPRRP